MDEKFYDPENNYKDPMDFDKWLEFGIRNGWCGPAVCSTHDGIPYSREEEAEWEEGHDPCAHILRLYESAEHKNSVEETHSPSQWRNHYTK